MTIYYPQQSSYLTASNSIHADSFDYDHYFAGIASVENIPDLGTVYEAYPTCRACRADWDHHGRRDEDCPAVGPLYRVFVRRVD